MNYMSKSCHAMYHQEIISLQGQPYFIDYKVEKYLLSITIVYLSQNLGNFFKKKKKCI